MSIVALKRVTVAGLITEKLEVLKELQRLGCVHLVPLQPPSGAPENRVTERPEECLQAIKYLRAVGRQRHQSPYADDFDVDEVVAQVLENKHQLREAIDLRDMLIRRIKDREPWGEFEFPPRDDLAGQRFWFYELPIGKKDTLEELDLPWHIVHQNNMTAYVVVISEFMPPGVLPVPRTRTGSESLRTLRTQLEDTELELDTLYAERDALTRWIYLLEQNIARAEDAAALTFADGHALEDERFFLVQGWVPEPDVERLRAHATENGLGLLVQDPAPGDKPPTLLENPPGVAGGSDLVGFYQTPAYAAWDPSRIVFFSFALFFAMILGDAGYGAVLLSIVGIYWKRMGKSELGRRMRALGLMVTGCSVAYGILAGSYFGISPPEGSLLGGLHIIEFDNFNAMIRLSVIIGAVHVALANTMRALYQRTWRDRFVPISWIAVIAGSLFLWLFGYGDDAIVPVKWGSIALMAGGALGVFVFGAKRKVDSLRNAILRVVGGLLSLTNATKVFGDVLSYLRLFALGLASASLAITFNQLAADVAAAAPGVGLLFKILILLLGHTLNLALAIISGVVHGLRLNFIEFFNWGMDEEGYPFRPFHKKEAES
jgi:V/A-type H+-transporting ATPase subunit I